MFELISKKSSTTNQVETTKQVSAFFFSACAMLFLVLAVAAPEANAQSGLFNDSLTDKGPPARTGRIDERDILITIASDTFFLSDTMPETLLVTVEAQGTDISGFDFTFAYDINSVEIYDAAPGGFLDSCNWEYFIVRRNPRCDGPCPNGLIKVIALAEFRDTERPKLCNTPAPGASLIKLLIRPTGETPRLSAEPLRFYWIDCGDNSISSVSGADLFIRSSVAEAGDSTQTLSIESEFPNYSGPIPDCFDKSTVNPPRRKIRFTNGALTLMFENPAADSLR